MIAVRIPKEIKAYKEKIVAGLTIRQLVSSVLSIGICVPFYIWGKDFLNEELISWLIIIIALPMAGIGFIKINGMPFEKFMIAVFRQQFLYPPKRKFMTSNFFREVQDTPEDSLTQGGKYKQLKKQASLERTFLIMEAESKGEDMDNAMAANLLTVRTKDPKTRKKKNRESGEKHINSKLKSRAEEIQKKQAEDPHYVITQKEGAVLRAYAKELEDRRKKEINAGIKQVSQKNSKMNKRKVAKSHIPKSTQDTIPYLADFEEGLFEVEPGKYSKCFLVKDINYLIAKEEEQISVFCKWGEFLNYFSEEMHVSVCIDNRVVSLHEQEQKVFYSLKNDNYDIHRNEYNRILRKQISAGKNDIQQTKYITVTISCDSHYEALLRFHKIEADVIANLGKIGSGGHVMSTDERLALLHDKFRKGREGDLKVDYEFLKEQGLSSKDYIAPSSFLFQKKNWFMIEDEYYRCMFLNNLPASLADDFLYELADCVFPIITTLCIQPVSQDKALRIVRKQLTGMEANKIEAEKKAMRAGYSPETISHDLKQSLNQAEELLDDMINKNQKMFFVTIGIMVNGRTLDDLEDNCKTVIGKARKFTCQIQNFDYQQEDAMKVILPMGITPNKKLFVERTLTTESTSIFIPFASQELFQPGGFYYGLNQISRNLILLDRTSMKTPSGFIFGSSGSGKSFATKREILNVLLNDDRTGVLIIDPEDEYGDFSRAFGGTIINISADSDHFMNPMDMAEDYGLDENDDNKATDIERKKVKALQKKADFIMSIIQCMLSSDETGESTINPQQKTIVDRCVKRCYTEYLNHDFDEAYLPTLQDLQKELDLEKGLSEDGRLLAEAVEYYTKGSMNVFSHKSNVNYNSRLVVFNIRDLGKQLKQISLLIVMDFIWNKMISNSQAGIRTYNYVDEIHVLFKNTLSAMYLQQQYKRGRKYGLVITGITQDVEDLLRSEMAKGMISNSDFIMMLNQSSENLKILAGMLNISEAQMNYVSRADPGSGLLFAEKTIVPFVDRFPRSSYLYQLMSTKFGENSAEDIKTIIADIIRKQKVQEESPDPEAVS